MTPVPGPQATLPYDMRAPEWGTAPEVLYRAALEQCAWADGRGFGSVTLTEHHATDDGYLPSPVVMASAIAGVTTTLLLRLSVVLLPLYHPLRLAEDLAVLDLISHGRLRLSVGLGYRAEEYTQLGVDPGNRARLMEEGVETLRAAWTGRPFSYGGRTVQVLPRPAQRPVPPIFMGATSAVGVRRAARLADGYQAPSPDLYDLYVAELARLGKAVPDPAEAGPATVSGYLFVAEDPDRTWARLAPFLLYDNNAYGAWIGAADGHFAPTDDADELRRRGTYRVVTPDECLAIARTEPLMTFKPLVGGLPPELGQESLQLFADHVVPRL